jgi:hypothetical protein
VKKLLDLSSVSEALTGAVGAVQRVDSALRVDLQPKPIRLARVQAARYARSALRQLVRRLPKRIVSRGCSCDRCDLLQVGHDATCSINQVAKWLEVSCEGSWFRDSAS